MSRNAESMSGRSLGGGWRRGGYALAIGVALAAAGCNEGRGPDALGDGPAAAAAPTGGDPASDLVSGGGVSDTAAGVAVARDYDPTSETRRDVAWRGSGGTTRTNDGTPYPGERWFYAFDGDAQTYWRLYQVYEQLRVGVRFFRDQSVPIEALGLTLAPDPERAEGPYTSFAVRVEVGADAQGPFTSLGRFTIPAGRPNHRLDLPPTTASYLRVVFEGLHINARPRIAHLRVYAAAAGAPLVTQASAGLEALDGLAADLVRAEREDVAAFGGWVVESRQATLSPLPTRHPRVILDRDPTTFWECKALDVAPATALIDLAGHGTTRVDAVLLRLPGDGHYQPVWLELIGSADRAAGIDDCAPIRDVLLPPYAREVLVSIEPTSLARLGVVVRSAWRHHDAHLVEVGALEARSDP